MDAGAPLPRVELRYTPLERLRLPRPVDRIRYVAGACARCRVLDLGAMDETAWQAKRGRRTSLHGRISRAAVRVDGFDSPALVPPEGLRTGPTSIIMRGDVAHPAQLVAALAEPPDVVV